MNKLNLPGVKINRDSFKNNKYISLDEFKKTLYDLTRNYLRLNYSLYFPEKKSPINRRHSLTEFLDLLTSKGYFNLYEKIEDIIKSIEDGNKIFNKLIDYQEYYVQSPNMFYKDEQTCVMNGIIISLKNNNFIDYLMDPVNTIPDHDFKSQKKSIGPKLRIQVWRKEIENNDEGQCPFYRCKNVIHNGLNGFHCGHIVSEFNGGETTLNNLRPICSSCNSRMGTTNWPEFEKEKIKQILLIYKLIFF